MNLEFLFIRGEIIHDKHVKDHPLPSAHVKLELIENSKEGNVVDQVDFICSSSKYPCPFEYWFDTSHIKGNATYQLEATLSAAPLLSRKTIHEKHSDHLARTKDGTSKTFQINPLVHTEISNYTITLIDNENIPGK